MSEKGVRVTEVLHTGRYFLLYQIIIFKITDVKLKLQSRCYLNL